MNYESGRISMKMVFVMIVIIIAVAVVAVVNFSQKRDVKDENRIKADMLLVQGACKTLKQNQTALKKSDMIVGYAISEIGDANKELAEFKKLGIIPEEDYSKYFILDDDCLNKLKIDVSNEKGSYYLINYDTFEVIITKGIDGKYKLSEMKLDEKEEEKDKNKVENKTKTETTEQTEEKTEESGESESEE